MMQSHVRHSTRTPVEGPIARQQRENAEQLRKLILSILRPVVVAAVLVAVAMLFGVEVRV